MSETTEQDKKSDKKRLSLNRPGRLELKKTVDAGPVRQNFSHGRSKMVAVEVRKKRTYAPDSSGKMSKVSEREAREAELAAAAASEAAEIEVEERPLSPDSPQLAGLTDEEKAQRIRVLEEARKAEEAARIEAERKAREAEEARKRQAEAQAEEAEAETEAEAATEAESEAAEAAEELTPEEQAQRIAEEQARQKEAEQQRPAKARGREAAAEEEEERAKPRKAGKTDAKKPSPSPRREERRRRSGKLTIVEAESFEAEEDRQRSLASVKRQRERDRQKQQELRQEGRKILREVTVPETITVQELANRMAERGGDVIKVLMKMGTMATINEYLDQDTAELVAAEFGHTIKRVSESDVEIGLAGGDDKEKDLQPRAPVVTVMGHVDHGKTSLLDALRQSDVAAHEAGGITQHIGAYQVESAAGGKITFIDTPGHAAFTEMRSRGAKVTDIVVLVVAADDGIMPQTVEAIDHARAAEVPIIVAINKIDKPGADANRVKTELLNHNIQVEDMGGEVLAVEVSALKRTGLDKLEEAIALQAELLDLRANPDRPAEGVIVESKMEQGRGSVATVLVQRGTLQVGDIFVAGAQWGRVRALIDAKGEQVDTAGPSVPVEVLGLQGTPQAGDEVVVVDSEARAREVSEFRQRRDREAKAALSGRGTLEQMFEKIKEGETQTLPVLVKADVHGSLEAILGALDKLGTEEVAVQVLHSGVGGINESDVTLARASDALVIGFNVRANPQAREHAKRDGVDIRYYSIIYNLTDDLKQMLSGMLAPALRENTLGYAEIREVFSITKTGKVAGCMVTEGMVKRGAKVRLLRDDVVIHEGELSQLKRFKDDVREVKEGFECGMAFANYQDIQVGDFIECFEVEEVAREI